jgi:hypothetical protein
MSVPARISRRTALGGALAAASAPLVPGAGALSLFATNAQAWGSWSRFQPFELACADHAPSTYKNLTVHHMGGRTKKFGYLFKSSDSKKVRQVHIGTANAANNYIDQPLLQMIIETRDGGNLNTIQNIEIRSVDTSWNTHHKRELLAQDRSDTIPPNGGRRLTRHPWDPAQSNRSPWMALTEDNPVMLRGTAAQITSAQQWWADFDFDYQSYGFPPMEGDGARAIHITLPVGMGSDFRVSTGHVTVFTIRDFQGNVAFGGTVGHIHRDNMPDFAPLERLTSVVGRTLSPSGRVGYVTYSFILDEPLTAAEVTILRRFNTQANAANNNIELTPSTYEPFAAADFASTGPVWLIAPRGSEPWRQTDPFLWRRAALQSGSNIPYEGLVVLTQYTYTENNETRYATVGRFMPIAAVNVIRNYFSFRGADSRGHFHNFETYHGAATFGNAADEFIGVVASVRTATTQMRAQVLLLPASIMATLPFAAVGATASLATITAAAAVAGIGGGVSAITLQDLTQRMLGLIELRSTFLTRADGNRFFRIRWIQGGQPAPLQTGGTVRNIFRFLPPREHRLHLDNVTTTIPVFFERPWRATGSDQVRLVVQEVNEGVTQDDAQSIINQQTVTASQLLISSDGNMNNITQGEAGNTSFVYPDYSFANLARIWSGI